MGELCVWGIFIMTYFKKQLISSGFIQRLINDPKISMKAKGLVFIMDAIEEDAYCTPQYLLTKSKDSRDAVYSAFKELIDNGYCETYPIKDKKGQVVRQHYNFKLPTYNG